MRRAALALTLLAAVAARADEPSPAPPTPPTQDDVSPAERPAPRAPLGVPAVMATPKPLGPTITLPPEESTPPPPPNAAARGDNAAARTNPYSTLADKAQAIINRTVIGGYGEFAFTKREGEDSAFDARRLVVFLYAPLHERISFATEIELEHGGSPLKSDGQFLPGEVQLEFAALDIKFFDWLVLRGGVILVPFGRFNINHDSPTQELTDRPLAVTLVVPATWFEAGVGLTGRKKIARGFELNHEIYMVNGLDSMITNTGGYSAARGSKLSDNNDDKAVVGRVGMYFFGPVGKRTLQLDLGVSGYSGAYDRRGRRTLMVGVDAGFRVGPFELLGEFVRAFNEPGFNDDFLGSTRAPVPTDLLGGFVEARLRIMPNALRRRLPTWLRESHFTLAIRYDYADLDLTTPMVGKHQRMTFGLNYRFIQAVAWKHELQLDHTSLHDPFDAPKLGYVTSLAFLF